MQILRLPFAIDRNQRALLLQHGYGISTDDGPVVNHVSGISETTQTVSFPGGEAFAFSVTVVHG